jgi:hypothetical protein
LLQIRSEQFTETVLIKCRRSRGEGKDGKRSHSAAGRTVWREVAGGGASRRPDGVWMGVKRRFGFSAGQAPCRSARPDQNPLGG